MITFNNGIAASQVVEAVQTIYDKDAAQAIDLNMVEIMHMRESLATDSRLVRCREKSSLRQHYSDGFALHVVVSLITGVVATTVAAPFDLLKSRTMASADAADGIVTVLVRLLRHEGPMALFNGWWPTYLRLGPHAILTFPLFEASRKLLGLEYL